MEEKLRRLEINYEINAGYNNETTIPTKEQQQKQKSDSPVLRSSLNQKAPTNTIPSPRRGTPNSNFKENWPPLKRNSENTCTPVPGRMKKQRRKLQPSVSPPGIPLKNRFTALDSLQDAAPATSQGHQEKSRNTAMDGKKAKRNQAKVLIILDGSINGIENFCSHNTNIHCFPR